MVSSKIIAIVQARVGSTRLPSKVMKKIKGKSLLWHIIKRLQSVNKIKEVIVATSNLKENDIIDNFCKKNNIYCFRGSETNVLKRFYESAKIKNADHVIRITADCPLVDPSVINNLIEFYFKNLFDFCGVACGAGVSDKRNIMRFPDGLDAEIFSFNVLEIAYLNAYETMHLEHVTPYIWLNRKQFKIGSLYPQEKDYSEYRFTIDNLEDFNFINDIYGKLYRENYIFSFREAVELIDKNILKPSNSHLIGEEGYDKFWK